MVIYRSKHERAYTPWSHSFYSWLVWNITSTSKSSLRWCKKDCGGVFSVGSWALVIVLYWTCVSDWRLFVQLCRFRSWCVLWALTCSARKRKSIMLASLFLVNGQVDPLLGSRMRFTDATNNLFRWIVVHGTCAKLFMQFSAAHMFACMWACEVVNFIYLYSMCSGRGSMKLLLLT